MEVQLKIITVARIYCSFSDQSDFVNDKPVDEEPMGGSKSGGQGGSGGLFGPSNVLRPSWGPK